MPRDPTVGACSFGFRLRPAKQTVNLVALIIEVSVEQLVRLGVGPRSPLFADFGQIVGQHPWIVEAASDHLPEDRLLRPANEALEPPKLAAVDDDSARDEPLDVELGRDRRDAELRADRARCSACTALFSALSRFLSATAKAFFTTMGWSCFMASISSSDL